MPPNERLLSSSKNIPNIEKHLEFLNNRMLEIPEDQNIHIHLFSQITQAFRMI